MAQSRGRGRRAQTRRPRPPTMTCSTGGPTTALSEAEAAAEIDADLDAAVLVAERDDYLDTLLRVQAEFENYKKRVARDEVEQRERAAAALAEKLLPVLDACDAAVGHGATDVEPIAKLLVDLLEREGLVRLAPAGEPFDPNLHEAVMHEPGDGGRGPSWPRSCAPATCGRAGCSARPW